MVLSAVNVVCILYCANFAIGQYIPDKGDLNTLYRSSPSWYGFFPPPNAVKSTWPQNRRTSKELKRTIAKKPNLAQLKANNIKRWMPHPQLKRPWVAPKVVDKRWKPVLPPGKAWMQKAVINKRWGPHLPPNKPLLAPKTIYKRWGPKFMIVENKPESIPTSDLIKNAKMVAFYPTAPENTPENTPENSPENTLENAPEHAPVVSLKSAVHFPAHGKETTESNLYSEKSALAKIESSKYSPTNEIYKTFVNTPPIIPNKAKHPSDIADFYANKPISKPTHNFIKRTDRTKEMVEKPSKIDSTKRILPSSPNPELEKLASNFLNTLSYKRFNAMEYMKSNKDYASNMYKKLLEGGESNDEITENFHHAADKVPERNIIKSREDKEPFPSYVKEREELIKKYMQQQGAEKELLNKRIKAIRDKAIEKYKEHHVENSHLAANAKPNSMHNKFTPNTQNVKNSKNSNYSKKISPTSHLDAEESSKHGASINAEQILNSRPKLQIGEDLHGRNEHEVSRENETLTKSDILELEEKVRKYKSNMESEPKEYKIKVKGGITTDAVPEPGTDDVKMKPTEPSQEESAEKPTSSSEESVLATKPIIPNFEKQRPRKRPFVKAQKQPAVTQQAAPPVSQLQSMQHKDFSQHEITTEGQGNIVAGQTLVKPFASAQKPQTPAEERIRKPLASDITAPLTAETTLSPAKGPFVGSASTNAASAPMHQVKPYTPEKPFPPEAKVLPNPNGNIQNNYPGHSENAPIIKPISSLPISPQTPMTSTTKPVGAPSETNTPISPSSSPILPSEAATPSAVPLKSTNQKVQELKLSLNGIGNQNPVMQFRRPPAESCTDNACEGNLLKDMKNKLTDLYDKLFLRGGNHAVEIYSTGCKGKDCSRAVGKIKFDGMLIGGGMEGMNIVVLGFPGYDFLFSKTYGTGKDPMEAAKMLKFLSGLKAPCVILIVAQGDATSGMTDGAWNMLADLGSRGSFIKSAGASLAFVGYKGIDVLPWTQVNQRIAGDGTSAIFAILGSDNEYITFGGSGQTLTAHVKEILSDEAINADARQHSNKTQLNEQTASGKQALKNKGITKFHSDISNNFVKVPLEAEAENEPASPTEDSLSKHESSNYNKVYSKSGTDLSSTQPTTKIHNFATPAIELNSKETESARTKTSESIVSIPVAADGDQNKTETVQTYEILESNSSPTDRSFEAGLSDSDSEGSGNKTVEEPKEVKILGQHQDGVKLQNGEEDGSKAASYSGEDRQKVNIKMPNNKTEDEKVKEHEDHTVESDHNTTDHHPKVSPEHSQEHPPEHSPEHSSEHSPEHSPEHSSEHSPEHSPEHAPEHSFEHPPEHLMEHSPEHHNPNQPFVGRVINTGQMNPRPMMPNQIYRPHSPDLGGHSGAQLYLPTHPGIAPHHPPNGMDHMLGPSIHTPVGDHVSYHHPMTSEVHSDDHVVEVHPVAVNNNEHGSVIAVTTLPMANNMHDSPVSVHNIDGYDGLGGSHHSGYMNNHDEENHYDNHHIPILNIPHPYVIQSNTPIEPHHEDGHELAHEPEHHMPEPEMHHPPHEEHETHEENHHEAHEKPMKPDNETKSEEKNERKTPAPLTPDIQAKLKELLAEELSKKLKELKISPDAALKGTNGKLENNSVAETTVKQERKDSDTSKSSTNSFITIKEENKDSATAIGETRENHQLGESNSDDSHNNVALEKMEHFVQGQDGDFADAQDLKNKKATKYADKKGNSSESEREVEESREYGTIKEEEEKAESSGEKELEQEQGSDKLKDSEESKDSVESDKYATMKEEKEKSDKTKTGKLIKLGVEISKYAKEMAKSNSKEHEDSSKETAEENSENKKQSEKEIEDSKVSTSSTDSTKFDNAKFDSYPKEEENSERPKPVKIDKSRNSTLDANNKLKSSKQFKGSEKTQVKDSNSVIKNGPGLHNGEPRKNYMVDTQEEFPDDTEKSETKPKQKSNLKSVEGLSDVSEMLGNIATTNQNGSPIAVEHAGTDKSNVDSCKRYRVLKNGKKIKLNVNKGCIEKTTVKKPKVQPLPDATEAVTALSMNPGYSTLPGAETRLSNREVSYYFDNKDKASAPSFKDNVYADNSNIYDQGDYVNTAESILQKDVSDAYNTANDIINAEEAIDRSKSIRKKKTLYKRSKRLKYPRDKKMKRTKLAKRTSEMKLDAALSETPFQW